MVTVTNAGDEASQSGTKAEAISLGTQEEAAAAVDFDFTVIIDGGPTVNSVTKSPPPPYTVPLSVTLSAVPDTAWRFDHWDSDPTDSDSPKEYWIIGSEVVTAHFVKRCFALNLSHTGVGTDPTAVAATTDSGHCPVGQYVAGQVLNLTASPGTHYVISGWSGTNNDGSTLTTNTATMPTSPPGDHAVSVTYTPICFSLDTSAVPTVGGTVVRSPDPNCPAPGPATEYLEGTEVSITANPAAGYAFTNWSGGLTGSINPSAVTMNMDYVGTNAVKATFEKACRPLSLSHTPPEGGSIPTAVPSKSAQCINPGEYVSGELITLSANYNQGWQVQSWVGTDDDTSTADTNYLTFPALLPNQDHLVTANYIEKPTLQFSAATYNVAENVSSESATITVTRSGSLKEIVTVDFETRDGTADENVDYYPNSGTLEFAMNVTEQTFSVGIIDDGTSEGPESIELRLTSPSSNAILGTLDRADLIILDDEGEPTVQFDMPTYQVSEDASSATVIISLFPPSSSRVYVDFETQEGTATEGLDYDHKQVKPIRFDPYVASKPVVINLLGDDLDENDETVLLRLSNVDGALSGQLEAVLTILDDDDPPTVQFDASVYYAYEGNSTAPLTVTLSAPSTFPVTVDFAVVDVAIGQQQFAGNLPFNPGEVSKIIDVPIGSNTAGDTLNAVLSGAQYATLASPSSATLLILPDNGSDCHLLTLTHTGYGTPPIPTIPKSPGCPKGHYVANELIDVSGQPDPSWFISRWQGTLNDNSTADKNVVRMPDGQHTVTIHYLTSAALPSLSSFYVDYFDGSVEVEPNDFLNTSKANGPIKSGQPYTGGFPIASDRFDIYFFIFPEKTNVQIGLANIPAGHDFNLYLWSSNKALKGYSGSAENQSEYISIGALPPELYYVGVHNASGKPTTAKYLLTVTYD
jgi:hypothetical protein